MQPRRSNCSRRASDALPSDAQHQPLHLAQAREKEPDNSLALRGVGVDEIADVAGLAAFNAGYWVNSHVRD
jgi:hypothetical protein